jgi:hypothetical protein
MFPVPAFALLYRLPYSRRGRLDYIGGGEEEGGTRETRWAVLGPTPPRWQVGFA